MRRTADTMGSVIAIVSLLFLILATGGLLERLYIARDYPGIVTIASLLLLVRICAGAKGTKR